jgi:hypothetical protein
VHASAAASIAVAALEATLDCTDAVAAFYFFFVNNVFSSRSITVLPLESQFVQVVVQLVASA